MLLQFLKLHPDVTLPTRKNASDAGADIRWFSPELPELELKPGESVKLKTGLKTHVPHGYALLVMNRSGLASEKVLKVGAQVIDPGYKGEIMINLHNDGLSVQKISHGDRVAQLLLIPVVHFRAFECESEEELYATPLYISERGTGGFGSSGE
jgi:dUTP pyrophosphatase